jgi:hypothetical protein
MIRCNENRYFQNGGTFRNGTGLEISRGYINAFNREGQILIALESVEYQGRNARFLSFKKSTRDSIFFYDLSHGQMTAFNGRVSTISDDFICIARADTFFVFDPNTMAPLFTTSDVPLFRIHDHWILGYETLQGPFIKSITKGDDVLYDVEPDTITYTSLARAITYKEHVKYGDFRITRESDLNQVQALSNLRGLVLRSGINSLYTNKMEVMHLDFSEFPDLVRLELRGFSDLSTLPISMKKLKALKRFECILNSKVTNIDEIVLALPNLEYLDLVNTSLSSNVRNALKVRHPNIQIYEEDMSDADFIDSTVKD